MSERPSLMDQAGLSNVGRSGGGGSSGGGMGGQKVKLIVAIVLLVVAGVAIAWSTGLLGGKGPEKLDPAEAAARQQRLDEEAAAEKKQNLRAPEPPVEAGG